MGWDGNRMGIGYDVMGGDNNPPQKNIYIYIHIYLLLRPRLMSEDEFEC